MGQIHKIEDEILYMTEAHAKAELTKAGKNFRVVKQDGTTVDDLPGATGTYNLTLEGGKVTRVTVS